MKAGNHPSPMYLRAVLLIVAVVIVGWLLGGLLRFLRRR
jgi:hypothetical protein